VEPELYGLRFVQFRRSIMATTNAHSSVTAKVNDGGTAVAAGEGSDVITVVKNLNDMATGSEYGSKVKADTDGGAATADPHGITTAKTGGGGLAYFPDHRAGDRNFIVRGAGDEAGKINNVASALLRQTGAEFDGVGRDTIHHTIADRKLGSHDPGAAATAAFDILAVPSTQVVPGRTKGTGFGAALAFNATTGDGTVAATDDAATPTRAVPGELTYHFGGLAKPTNDLYKARDGSDGGV
jgi:hypothetical protein